ncbi:DUF5635 domain-containing protein [Corynebacterium sp. AOP40-9SA-29]|uniref:DUF5635 domain-containing protein n=1 Tax=Corynebacterium sp. AOP40-9SA-29 TaxID=3457677 RepID=UPI0040342A98
MNSTGIERRQELEKQVRLVLDTATGGRITLTDKTKSVGLKEEAGRRNGPDIEPGRPENPTAATALADEVACMSNSPGGGALIVGFENCTGRIIGTELGVDWLRSRIWSGVGIAPDIVEEHLEGLRILVVYAAEAREPVEDTGGRIRWRVGDHCRPIDRAQWWEHRDRASSTDPMAQSSGLTMDDVRSPSVDLARQWRRETDRTEGHVAGTDEELLRALGALRSDGNLTQAGALLFTSANRTVLEFTEFDVPGGTVSNTSRPRPDTSVLEQLSSLETVLSSVNTRLTLERGLHHEQLRRIPERAVRESLLNGLIHRDWNRSEPTDVRWSDLDSSLTVRSPGGFPGEVTPENILSNREARYPALADLFRALGLVDKQGVGVDRMYRDMIVVGHRPPDITEEPGQYVQCTLTGGSPVYPVLDCVRAILPEQRQQDFRIAVILYQLLHRAFITRRSTAAALQSTQESAAVALEAARQTTVRSEPLILRHKDAWILGAAAREQLTDAYDPHSAFPIVPYLSTDATNQAQAAQDWVDEFGSVTTGDLHVLTGTARGTVKRTLDGLVDEGELVNVGAGRSSRYEHP